MAHCTPLLAWTSSVALSMRYCVSSGTSFVFFSGMFFFSRSRGGGSLGTSYRTYTTPLVNGILYFDLMK